MGPLSGLLTPGTFGRAAVGVPPPLTTDEDDGKLSGEESRGYCGDDMMWRPTVLESLGCRRVDDDGDGVDVLYFNVLEHIEDARDETRRRFRR
jgi:hypothetical protein